MLISLILILMLLAQLILHEFQIRTDIIINAKPDRVWQTIIDLKNYSQWNTRIEYLYGEVEHNGFIYFKLIGPDTVPNEYKVQISSLEENQQTIWLSITIYPGLLDLKHHFELEDIGNGQTRLINNLQYSGLLSLSLEQFSNTKKGLNRLREMNKDLKSHVEGFLANS